MRSLILIAILQIFTPYLELGQPRDLTSLDNSSCPQIQEIDRAVRQYMSKYGFVGAQLAVMKNNSLVYAKGYGWADKEDSLKMDAGNIMRVASVSKLITAVGIMKLVEMGRIRLEDKVFDPQGPLGRERFTAEIRDSRAMDITVEHLLRHQAGFTSRNGDPMFRPGNICGEDAVCKSLRRALAFAPGTSQEYSNVGFYLLSLIIERVGGDTYENWMMRNVLIPMHCGGFRIAGNYREQRWPREVTYYMHAGSEPKPDFHGNGNMVEACYGGNNVTGLSGAGAWVANAAMLCRFVAGIDLDYGIRSILTRESVDRMTEYFDEHTFSLGWNDTNPQGVWTRTGSFSGTTAIIKNYCNESECWVLITNTSTYMGPRIAKQSAALIEKMRIHSDKLPSKNLFYK